MKFHVHDVVLGSFYKVELTEQNRFLLNCTLFKSTFIPLPGRRQIHINEVSNVEDVHGHVQNVEPYPPIIIQFVLSLCVLILPFVGIKILKYVKEN